MEYLSVKLTFPRHVNAVPAPLVLPLDRFLYEAERPVSPVNSVFLRHARNAKSSADGEEGW